jgi:uncharacterized lipoprotein YmbA
MTSDGLSRRRLLAGAGLLAAMTGCAASTPPRLFTLASRPGTSPGDVSVRVVVKPVEVAKYLDRTQIVRYSDSYELQVFDLERWGEGMRDMTTRVLIENLSLRLPAAQVVSESSPVSLTADVTLEVDISRFDADSSGQVVLDAHWAMQRERRPSGVKLARIRVRPASTSVTDLVAAMSDAFGQLSDQIAQGVVA